MPSMTVVYKLLQYVIAFMIGIAFYYGKSSKERTFKKKAIDQFLSYLINFIIYIWVAKIVLNLPLFVKDPFAVLPYPSTQPMFYLAQFLLGIHLFVQYKRQKVNKMYLQDTFMPIMLMSLFIYDFIDFKFNHFNQSLATFILYSVLILLFLFIKRVKTWHLVIIWAAIQLIFASYFSYTTIYGYLIAPYYFIVILLLAFGYKLWQRRQV
ncbi:MAG TPA: hypothetical protein VK075_06910 [Pseudogracilibacillus sp.]|nr:hypothetical protein [Pseudogracilibacillus sp.]